MTNEWRAFDYMDADRVEGTCVQRGEQFDPYDRLSFDAYDDEHAAMWCKYLNELEAYKAPAEEAADHPGANYDRWSDWLIRYDALKEAK